MASHRIVQWVTKTKGSTSAERLYDLLNKRHFVEGRKLNDSNMLADAAREAADIDEKVCPPFEKAACNIFHWH